ncbi:IS1182 family transposase [Deinococcus saxicola]|uniref:IS1182 family transposase n=1 Tax=Deinococcus saxicola TaxID=249406 RepID=UPI0039F13DD0
MSLKPAVTSEIPELTQQVARAAFPKGCAAMRLRDEFGMLYQDADFADLFPKRGQPALPAWRLALVTVLQFLENVSDRQAADQVRGRIDWKYALGLELHDAGFHFSVLSEFRARLVKGEAEYRLLDRMLDHFQDRGLVKARGKQRTDSTHVLGAVRDLHLAELVGETLRATLNQLADLVPEWLTGVAQPQWFKRYAHRVEDTLLPKTEAKRRLYVLDIGADGYALLDALDAPDAPCDALKASRVALLRQVWDTHFDRSGETLRWKEGTEFPPVGERIQSPYDPEMHFSTKRSTEWSGYKVHLTETCDDDEAHLVTHVHTTAAMDYDGSSTAVIHDKLAAKNLLPSKHFVDAAYTDAELLVSSAKEHGVQLMGPIRQVSTWQSRQGLGYDTAQFQIDWEQQHAICPQGKISGSWRPGYNEVKHPIIRIRFRRSDCGTCPTRTLCTAAKDPRRTLLILHQAEYEALNAARVLMKTPAFKFSYRVRAGIEGTISQGVHCVGLRQSRYIGLARTRLHHVVSATAMNVSRIVAWLDGRPRAATRVSSFSRLLQAV